MKRILIKRSLFICGLFAAIPSFAQNVGLGITTPLSKLHIKGSENIAQLLIDANSTQSNTSPFIKLRSSFGTDLLWIHSDTSFNTFIGLNTGRVNNAVGGGVYNTFIGRDAGYSNTIGNSNTAHGFSALFSNSSGTNNSALGKEALYRNTTGNYNTASGSGVLYSNTTGSLNSAHGYQSLYSNTTGGFNSAHGYAALYSNTTGRWNSAHGVRALYSNTTGVYNSAHGIDALGSNISGSGNTATGNSSIYNNTTGTLNSAHGYLSLHGNTSGHQNTAHGSYSMGGNSTGSYNTAVGYESLYSNGTGTYNAAIGYKANVASGELNNATAIGANAYAGASNSVVIGSINGINGATSSANVGVGTTAPHSSSIMELSSTTQGMILPRMTTAQRKAIPGPAPGLLVYDLDKLTLYMFDGLKWNPMLFTTNEQKLPGYPVHPLDESGVVSFGHSVSINGDYALVGAPNSTVGNNIDQGSAYIFVRNAGLWQQQAILTSSTGVAGDQFGFSVELNATSDAAIIGARNAIVNGNTTQGTAYIFIRTDSTWTQQAKLTASDGASGDRYGTSVSMKGDYAIVGALGDNTSAGSAYIYFKNGQWMDNQSHQAKIVASDGQSYSRFGTDVSISGNYTVVGAPDNLSGAGAIYIFNRSGTTWAQVAKIAGDGERLGASVSMDGDYIAAGAPHFNGARGVVKIYFRGSGWVDNQSPQASLSPIDLIVNDEFGDDVCISGDYVIGGIQHTYYGSDNPGASYLYKRTGTSWNLIRKCVDDVPQFYDFFGTAVSIQGNNLINGIPYKNNKGEVQFINIE